MVLGDPSALRLLGHARCEGEAMLTRSPRPLSPRRALLHPAWLASVALLALNDHVLKGAHVLPGVITGKLSDFAGLFAAPALLAVLVRARSARSVALCHLAVGVVFAAIKTSSLASLAFTTALGLAGVPWRNWVDPTDLVALPMLLASFVVLMPWMRSTVARPSHLWSRAAIVAGLPVMLASGENMGGANQGGAAPGSGKTGVDLAVGDIAVEPGGGYFLSRQGSALLIGDLETRRVESLPGLPSPDRVAFWSSVNGRGFFLLSKSGYGSETLVSYDVDRRAVAWKVSLGRSDSRLQPSEQGDRLVLAGSSDILVLDAATGAPRGSFSVPGGIADIEVDGANDRLIAVENTRTVSTDPAVLETHIHVRRLVDASATCEIVAPNCADQLVLAPGGQRAFLAPTTCQRDPVSVLDLATCTFEKNLPGFGPVALSQNGRTAVAFVDRDSKDPMAPALPAEVTTSADRYHLMFIDVATLAYGTTPIGANLPRYAVTPDGRLLLVDSAFDAGSAPGNVRILDIDEKSIRTVVGPYVQLESYVLLPDSSVAYAVWGDLFRIDTDAATATKVPLPFKPTAVNMVPSGATLLLKDGSEHVHLFDVSAGAVVWDVR
jgi:hypothetical protein